MDDYMNNDIEKTTCQVLALQEVEIGFCDKMAVRSQRATERLGQGGGDGTPKPLFIGVRGDEGKENSLLIPGKPGIVLGVRLRVFHRRVDGAYTEKGRRKIAVSRTMVADLKMKHFRLRGCGDVPSDILTVANVHMHSRTAKKNVQRGATVYKAFLG